MMVKTEFTPTTFIVTAPKNVRANRNFTIEMQVTASEITKTTIRKDNEEEVILEPYNKTYVEDGTVTDYAYGKSYRIKTAGTYTFTITVYGKNGGTAVKTATVVVK